MSRRAAVRERGFALMAVMFLAAVAMLAATGLIGDGAVAERRVQDATLLNLRAYWAGQGHISYVMSRSLQGPPCGDDCENAAQRAEYVAGVLAELDSAGSARAWAYPEVAANYVFPVATATTQVAPYIVASVSYPAAATANPLIAANWPVRSNYVVYMCVGVPNTDTPCHSANLEDGSGVSYIALMTSP